MHREISDELFFEVAGNFAFRGRYKCRSVLGNGHINDTFIVAVDVPGQGEKKAVLQRINTDVFKDPAGLMENILGVTSFLRERIIRDGGDPNRETLYVIPALDGRPYYIDSEGSFWRSYRYIDETYSCDFPEDPKDFYESALAFGRFQSLLADYPAQTLNETIPGFHDTAARYQTFLGAACEDAAGRASSVQKEIAFLKRHEDIAHFLPDLMARGEIPLRVIHNDAKLSNVLFDKKSGKGICIVDLDTVMPGLAVNDFGDAIRFGAGTAAEDEPIISKVSFSMELFEHYTRGYLEGCGGRLTSREIELLPMGAIGMTYESALRFLTDYLQGDIYFKIDRPDHNLIRCHTQLKLLADMLEKKEQMRAAVKKYKKECLWGNPYL